MVGVMLGLSSLIEFFSVMKKQGAKDENIFGVNKMLLCCGTESMFHDLG